MDFGCKCALSKKFRNYSLKTKVKSLRWVRYFLTSSRNLSVLLSGQWFMKQSFSVWRDANALTASVCNGRSLRTRFSDNLNVCSESDCLVSVPETTHTGTYMYNIMILYRVGLVVSVSISHTVGLCPGRVIPKTIIKIIQTASLLGKHASR